MARTYRAGDSVEDYCRACKTDRMHVVVAADNDGRPLRVVCGYCDSEHNFRGGPRIGTEDPPARPAASGGSGGSSVRAARPERDTAADRQRAGEEWSSDEPAGPRRRVDIEMLLRRIIREETGITPVTPAEKWRGGTMVLRPGNPQLQDKSWPIETFFHKVVMLRNRLRTLEQQINATDLPEDVKIKVQGYISGCYGSLTSFNILFADEADQFKGSSSD